MLTLIFLIWLVRKREKREALLTVLAVYSLFWPRFADHRFKFDAWSALKVPGYVASF